MRRIWFSVTLLVTGLFGETGTLLAQSEDLDFEVVAHGAGACVISVCDEVVEPEDTGGGGDRVGGDEQVRAVSSVATTDLAGESANVWWTLVATGYDCGYDLAMVGSNEAHWFEVAGAKWGGLTEQAGRLGGRLRGWWTKAQSAAWWEQVAERISVADPWRGMDWNVWDCAPQEDVSGRGPAPEAPEVLLDKPAVGVTVSIAPQAGIRVDEERVLLAAADSLERIGEQLQEAAGQLRLWAAYRMVAKDLRRVAQKPATEQFP